ncbi:MAG: hypothetical protein ACREOQ_18120 [Gemmatimonadales bacterium]
MWTARMALFGLVALAAGCGASRSSTADTAPKQGHAEAVKIEIDNRNYSDMSIYLINDGSRVLIGSAPGLSKTTLPLPAGSRLTNWRVRLLADPLGGSATIRTPSLLVAPGQRVYWTIGSDNASSFASAG